MDDADVARARAEAPRPDLLDELVATGRAVFGFFPNHYPHTLNYPWVLERLEPLRPGARVLDVGAGVSPLPIVLSRRGILVDSVDKSSTSRTMPVGADWNEWGFFDYSVVDPAHPFIPLRRTRACAGPAVRPRLLGERARPHDSAGARGDGGSGLRDGSSRAGGCCLRSTSCRRATSSGTARRESRSSPRPSTAPSTTSSQSIERAGPARHGEDDPPHRLRVADGPAVRRSGQSQLSLRSDALLRMLSPALPELSVVTPFYDGLRLF